MQPEQQQRIMGYFIEEAKEHLNTIEQGLLNLQSTLSDQEMTNELFRAAHSVKGGAAMLGLNSIQRVSHRLEDFFKVLKDSPVQVDQKLETLFLQVFDALQELLGQLQSPFGLSEDTANATVAGVEPSFTELEQHLNALATASPASSASTSAPPEPVRAVQSRPESALVLLFSNDIPVRLREMLQLFKQSESDPAVRQALQSICRNLISIGEQFELPDWCRLVQMASQAIATPDHSYRTLAPIVIKDIKQAQELVLAGRAEEIFPCIQLQDLVPLPESSSLDASLDSLDLDAGLDSFTDFLELESDGADFAAEPLFASESTIEPTFEEFTLGEPLETVGSPSAAFDSSFGRDEKPRRNGPEVGIAELNSLADLFEGEVPDLGSTWQDEEVLNEGADSLNSPLDESFSADVQNDFSDLFDQPAAQSAITTETDLNELFKDELLEDSSLEQEGSIASIDFLNLDSAQADEEDLAGFFSAVSSDGAMELELSAIDAPRFSEETDLFGDLDTPVALEEPEETDLFGDLDLDAFSENAIANSTNASDEAASNGLDGLFDDLQDDLDEAAEAGDGWGATTGGLENPFEQPRSVPEAEVADLWGDDSLATPTPDAYGEAFNGSLGQTIEPGAEIEELSADDLVAPEPLEELTDLDDLDFSALLESSPVSQSGAEQSLEELTEDDAIDLSADWLSSDTLPKSQAEPVLEQLTQPSIEEIADPWSTHSRVDAAPEAAAPETDPFSFLDDPFAAAPIAESAPELNKSDDLASDDLANDLTGDIWSLDLSDHTSDNPPDDRPALALGEESLGLDALGGMDFDGLEVALETGEETIELRDDLSFDLDDLDLGSTELAQAEVLEAIEELRLEDELSEDALNFDLNDLDFNTAADEQPSSAGELDFGNALSLDLDDLGFDTAAESAEHEQPSSVGELDFEDLSAPSASDLSLDESLFGAELETESEDELFLGSLGSVSPADLDLDLDRAAEEANSNLDLFGDPLEPAALTASASPEANLDLDFDRPAEETNSDLDLFGDPLELAAPANNLDRVDSLSQQDFDFLDSFDEDILLGSGTEKIEPSVSGSDALFLPANELASSTDDLFTLDELELADAIVEPTPQDDPFGFGLETDELGTDELKTDELASLIGETPANDSFDFGELGELEATSSELTLEDDLFELADLEAASPASEDGALDDLVGSDDSETSASLEAGLPEAKLPPDEFNSELDLFSTTEELELSSIASPDLSFDLDSPSELDLSSGLDAASTSDGAVSPELTPIESFPNFEDDFASLNLESLEDQDEDGAIVSGLNLEDDLLGLEALSEPTTAVRPSDLDPFGFDLPSYTESDRSTPPAPADDLDLFALSDFGLDETDVESPDLGEAALDEGNLSEFSLSEFSLGEGDEVDRDLGDELFGSAEATSDTPLADPDFSESDFDLESGLESDLNLFDLAGLEEATDTSSQPESALGLEAGLFDLSEPERFDSTSGAEVLDFSASANAGLDADFNLFSLDEPIESAGDFDRSADAELEAELFDFGSLEPSAAPSANEDSLEALLGEPGLDGLEVDGVTNASGLDLFLDNQSGATSEELAIDADLNADLNFDDRADLTGLAQFLAEESAADQFSGLDDLLFESSSAEDTGEFDDLDNLLGFEPSEAASERSASLDGLEDLGGNQTAENDFSELDNLLDDQDSAGDPFGDLDNLLGAAAGATAAIGAASLANQTTQSASQSAAVDDFGDLDALLQGIEPIPSQPTELIDTTAVDPGFDELDDLLKEAEEKMGGSPSFKPSRGPVQPTRRAAARQGRGFVEQTMRVPVKHLDNLSNLVGELVVNRNSLEQDQERLRQSLDNLLYQVQQLSDVGQRMQDLYERSLLESSLLAGRQGSRSGAFSLFRDSQIATQTASSTGVEYDPLEMDRFTGFHSLSQEMIELIVRVRESSSDIEFIVDETDQVTRMFRQVTTQLQEGLTRSRMVPFAQTADRLPRAVRDISMQVGKQAELQIEGRETLIDKMILEQLYDPMTHLVNNALTHGIESPAVRRAAGKPATGRITIRAFHQGNQTIISVSDDGAGIDVDRVKAKAIEKGVITPTEAKAMSRLDVYDLLFQAGFSTKDKADDFSGRGVGMDVVRTSLSEIRGVVSTDSTPGKGTSFTIRLPLTLSISKALCCISDRARVAFPMDGVEDMLDLPKERLQTDAEGRPSISWRDSLLPLYPLSELLGYNRHLSRGNVYGGNQEDDITSIVVLRSAGNFLALQVDQVLGEQEIVIKQLEGPVPKPIGVAGATVLGDGRIMPIADVLELIDLSMGRIRKDSGGSLWEQDGAPVEPPVAKMEPTVLIVDDSITVRELLSMTFNKVGYRVEQARDGQEAWEKLRSGLPCDIVFCDIEMPRMDGLELLSRIQKDPNLNHLPIAMLTSRGADRHRQMAASLGANGYFTKPYLEEALLDAAQRMLKGEVLLSVNSNS